MWGRCWLLFPLTLAGLGLLGQQPRGVTVVQRSGQQFVEGKRWVVLIGCDQYESNGIPALKYGVADAKALEQVLDQPGAVVVRLGTDAEAAAPARRNAILGRVRAVADNAGASDEIVVFFSGHGMGGTSTTEQYLLPSDAVLNDLEDTAISLQRLEQILAQSAAGVKVLLVDACRSLGKGPEWVDATRAEGLFVLQSCEQGQVSLEDPTRQEGRFSYWMRRGLAGEADDPPSGNQDGYVAFDELFRFCGAGMQEDEVRLGGVQRPKCSMLQASGIPVLAKVSPKGTRPVTRTGSLVISVAPVDAVVQVGDQPARNTQDRGLTLEDLQPGNLSVVVRANGYEEARLSVTIKAGEPATVAVTLQPVGSPAGPGLHALATYAHEPRAPVTGIVFLADGQHLASCAGTSVELWDMSPSGRPSQCSLSGPVQALAAVPDDRLLAGGAGRLWLLSTREKLEETIATSIAPIAHDRPFDARALAVAWRPRGEYCYVATRTSLLKYGSPTMELQGQRNLGSPGYSAGWASLFWAGRNADSELVLVLPDSIIALNGDTLEAAWSVQMANTVTAVASSTAYHGRIAIGFSNGTVSLIDGIPDSDHSGDAVTLPEPKWNAQVCASAVSGLAFSRDGGRLVATGSGGELVVQRASDGAKLAETAQTQPLVSVACSPVSDLFATGDSRGGVQLWELK